jgi:hypothetical protein
MLGGDWICGLSKGLQLRPLLEGVAGYQGTFEEKAPLYEVKCSQ